MSEAEHPSAAAVIATAATDETLLSDQPGWFGFFQRGWRPAFAWELLLECMAMVLVLGHEVWTHDLETMNILRDHQTFFELYLTMRFTVIGVFGAGRTAEKISAIKAALAVSK